MPVRNSKPGKDAAKPPASRAAKARKDESRSEKKSEKMKVEVGKIGKVGKAEKKTQGKSAASGASRVGETREGETQEKAAGRFVEDLLIRGEAAYPDEHGNLPSGATHEIVKDQGGGKTPTTPKVKRRRFSAY